MHSQAFAAIEDMVSEHNCSGARVVEYGSRDVNGSVRELFTGDYLGLDREPGPGVDVVADGADWDGDHSFDVAVSTEALEHTRRWRQVVDSMARAVRPGGWLFITCATEPRAPHSAVDGGQLQPGEDYNNVDPIDMEDELGRHCSDFHVETHTYPGHGGDLYAWGRTAQKRNA